MERMIGLILIVAAIFIGVEFYTEGDHAFGGIFASDDAPAAAAYGEPDDVAPAERTWAGERAGNKVQRLHEERGQRIKNALD